MNIKIFRDKKAVAESFSKYFAEVCARKGKKHIALSGGSTPKIVFDFLAAHFRDKINWAEIFLYWGDERCVPPSDDQSNYKMTQAHLLSKIEIPQENIHRILGENDPEKEAGRYAALLENELPTAGGFPQFDLVILGMGDDGHTASIFPHEIQLWDSDRHCEVAVHPDSGQRRVTLTGGVINHAREVAFLVTGANKSEKLYQILNKKEDYLQYPAALVDPVSGKLHWFLDEDAAASLSSD